MRQFAYNVTLSLIITFAYSAVYAQKPSILQFTPAKGPVGTLIIITGGNFEDSSQIKVGGVAALKIAVKTTEAVVMVMPGTTGGKVLIETSKGVAESNTSFNVSATKPPSAQQGNKLIGTNGVTTAAGVQQGSSVALSADGNTMVEGSQYDSVYSGAIWIFSRNNGTWKQQGHKLKGLSAGGRFGYSVAISADGNTVIAGQPFLQDGVGGAFIYVRQSDSSWIRQGEMLLGSAPNTYKDRSGFGTSVSLSADGNTAVVGGPSGNALRGAVWVFRRNNGIWKEEAKLSGNDGTGQGSAMGQSVAISANRNTIIAGGPLDNENVGAAWVFVYKNGAWLQQGNKLVGKDETGEPRQANAVAINADGNTAVVGAYGDSVFRGAFYVFARDTATNAWAQQGAKLIGSGSEIYDASQGSSVAISADGNNVIEGGPNDIRAHRDTILGSAWIFTRNTAKEWKQYGPKLRGRGSPSMYTYQGTGISISAQGNTAAIGGPGDDDYTGATWIFIDSIGALPVTIADIRATVQGNSVQIQWNGFNETNLKNYEIERCSDALQFIKIGQANIKGANSENYYTYTWQDDKPGNGNNFYRIKAISNDGLMQYSKVVKIKIDNSSIKIYPNPVINKKIQFQFNNIPAGAYTVMIYNASGQKVYSGNYYHNGSTASLVLLLKNIAAGSYHVEVSSKDVMFKDMIVVQ